MRGRVTTLRQRFIGPAALCRLDGPMIADISEGSHGGRLLCACLVNLTLGSAVFGAVFGGWRSWQQGLLCAVKMPILMLAVTGFSAVVNTLMAQALGARISFRQTLTAMVLAFAVCSVVLAACAPITAFFAWQSPAPGQYGDRAAYRALLVLNTTVVGLAGVVGNIRLFRVLVVLAGARRKATRVLMAWLLMGGLTGCELSWVLSPFLARPDTPVPVLNPNAFRSNFFEYLFNTAAGRALPGPVNSSLKRMKLGNRLTIAATRKDNE